MSLALAQKQKKFILWPSLAELQVVKRGFYDKGGFPGVIGCVDGTHVRIQAPSTNENDFVNRKGFQSINVQAMCNHNGSEHKAKINESFMPTMSLPSRKSFIQGRGLVMEAIFGEVTKFLLFCFCFCFLSSGDSPTCLLLLEQYDLLSPPHSRLSLFLPIFGIFTCW